MPTTTDHRLRSFVPVPAESHFPIQNLPYGVFRPRRGGGPRVGTAIGERVLDLAALEARGLLDVPAAAGGRVFDRPSLNAFMALGRETWREVRCQVSHLLREDVSTLRDDAALRDEALLPMGDVEMLLPVEVGDYTDFYSSREHATNVGTMLRGPENALMPNWLHLPVAYHGRASSVVVSGTDLHRPLGQTRPEGSEGPVFGPSRAVDFELEMGSLIGPGNRLGEPVPAEQALEHVFGLVLVNDWSARDVQKWEYVPLGPFLSKSFGTSISPWVVPLAALEPFRTEGSQQDPEPLPYLRTAGNPTWDIHLEVWLQCASSEEALTRRGQAPSSSDQTQHVPVAAGSQSPFCQSLEGPHRVCASNFRHLYWNVAQQVAHHTVGGCNLRPGDLLASGTISGPTPESRGCLLELTWGGSRPLELPNGQTRRFLEDGDRVTMTGWCQGDGYRVGFGEVTGRVLPARS